MRTPAEPPRNGNSTPRWVRIVERAMLVWLLAIGVLAVVANPWLRLLLGENAPDMALSILTVFGLLVIVAGEGLVLVPHATCGAGMD